jgi:hypothetical protein
MKKLLTILLTIMLAVTVQGQYMLYRLGNVYYHNGSAYIKMDTTLARLIGLSNYLPLAGTAANSFLLQGKDSIYIKANWGGNKNKFFYNLKMDSSLYFNRYRRDGSLGGYFAIDSTSIGLFSYWYNGDQNTTAGIYTVNPGKKGPVPYPRNEFYVSGNLATNYSIYTQDSAGLYQIEQDTTKHRPGSVVTWQQLKAHTINNDYYSHYSNANTSGTGETQFYADTIPGGTLSKNGDQVSASYAVTVNSSDGYIKIYFDGTALTSRQMLSTYGTVYVKLDITIIRQTSSAFKYITSYSLLDNSNVIHLANTINDISPINWSSSAIIKITGESSTGSMTANLGYVKINKSK